MVDARHGGGSKWFPGKISAVNEDGTYGVAYNDGDRERAVKAALLRNRG